MRTLWTAFAILAAIGPCLIFPPLFGLVILFILAHLFSRFDGGGPRSYGGE